MAEVMDREKTMARIQKLLDKAASTDFNQESKVFLQKADDLMMKYQIEEFELRKFDAKTGGEKIPEVRDVATFAQHPDLKGPVATMARMVASLNGLIIAEWHHGKIKVCGWTEDIDYFEMTITNLILTLVRTMDPKYDPDLPLDENVYLMKSAGLNWTEIWRRIKGEDVPVNRSECIKWSKFHKAYCERHGLERVTVSHKSGFREDFAWGFQEEVCSRIQSVIAARDVSEGGALVLANRESDLQQWFQDQGFETWVERAQRISNEMKAKGVKTRLPRTRYRNINQQATAMGRKAGSQADIGLKGVR